MQSGSNFLRIYSYQWTKPQGFVLQSGFVLKKDVPIILYWDTDQKTLGRRIFGQTHYLNLNYNPNLQPSSSASSRHSAIS